MATKMKMPHPLEQVFVEHAPVLCQAAQSGPHAALVAIRRLINAVRPVSPTLAEAITTRLSSLGGIDSTRRHEVSPTPETIAPSTPAMPWESRNCVDAAQPVLAPRIAAAIEELVQEYRQADRLLNVGLAPRATVMLIGPPGVGKTMLASWIARQLAMPLIQINLSQAISSFLGRTGSNITDAISWARRERCVLLFDEFDALAKRRDDVSDIGELKRVVSVLLKELEEWHGPGLILAATNHPDLIDPAIFRRFDLSLTLENPDVEQAETILIHHLAGVVLDTDPVRFAAQMMAGRSGSALKALAMRVRRQLVLNSDPSPTRVLLRNLAEQVADRKNRKVFVQKYRAAFPAAILADIATLLNVSIGTIHSDLKGEDSNHG